MCSCVSLIVFLLFHPPSVAIDSRLSHHMRPRFRSFCSIIISFLAPAFGPSLSTEGICYSVSSSLFSHHFPLYRLSLTCSNFSKKSRRLLNRKEDNDHSFFPVCLSTWSRSSPSLNWLLSSESLFHFKLALCCPRTMLIKRYVRWGDACEGLVLFYLSEKNHPK